MHTILLNQQTAAEKFFPPLLLPAKALGSVEGQAIWGTVSCSLVFENCWLLTQFEYMAMDFDTWIKIIQYVIDNTPDTKVCCCAVCKDGRHYGEDHFYHLNTCLDHFIVTQYSFYSKIVFVAQEDFHHLQLRIQDGFYRRMYCHNLRVSSSSAYRDLLLLDKSLPQGLSRWPFLCCWHPSAYEYKLFKNQCCHPQITLVK